MKWQAAMQLIVKFSSSFNRSYYFTVKTIKVDWEESEKSFMHVFIDTTSIRKLEEQRAKNKCQQLMFSSISHEFRTPINAFSNSINLIDLTLEKVNMQVNKLKNVQPEF
jgi:signal transduction histidine kinase